MSRGFEKYFKIFSPASFSHKITQSPSSPQSSVIETSKGACLGATASWTAATLRRFGGAKSAKGLARSTIWRQFQRFMEGSTGATGGASACPGEAVRGDGSPRLRRRSGHVAAKARATPAPVAPERDP